MIQIEREKLERVLGALEKLWLLGDHAGAIANPAITNIKEALAQPDAFEQGRQEGMKQERALWELSKLGQEIEAQPERPWGGLTHKEMYDVIRPLCSADEMATWLLEISEDEYLAIEAKLKEKNT